MIKFQQNLLKELGYDTIALPKEDIHPLLLLADEGQSVSSLGWPLQTLFKPDIKPLVLPGKGVSDINVERMFTFDAGLGLDFLSAIFQYFKLDESKLKAGLKANKGMVVNCSFHDVKEELVAQADIDSFLTGAIPRENEFRTYEKKLKDSELYVITNVLRSSSFKIELEKSGSGGFNLDASVAKLAEGKTHIDRENERNYVISNTSGKDLAFAFKAYRIIYDKKSWWQFWKADDAGFRLRRDPDLVMRSVEDGDADMEPLNVADGVLEL